MERAIRRLGPAAAFALFAAAASALPAVPVVGALALPASHDLDARLGVTYGELADLLTPFGVIGASLLVLAVLRPRAGALALAAAAAILYADGHGMHLAANSINARQLPIDAARTANFWDEQLGHIEWHAGLLGLMGAACLAERRGERLRWRPALFAAGLLGASLFVYPVEGGSWWLVLLALPLFVARAAQTRSHIALTSAAALVLAALLIGLWAAWWGDVPQFTELRAAGKVT